MLASIPLEIFVTFANFRIQRPQIHENTGAVKLMMPCEARLRNFTYGANMTLDIRIKYIIRSGPKLSSEQTFHREMKGILIGKLPIMLQSSVCILSDWPASETTGECPLDPGGYFIINGSEKTCLGQERAAENTIQCFNTQKTNSRWDWTAEIKSVPDFKCISPKQITIMIASRKNGQGSPLLIQIPRIKNPVNLVTVFRALGVESDRGICDLIAPPSDRNSTSQLRAAFEASIIEAGPPMTSDEALECIAHSAMYTPINLTKEEGLAKKKAFTQTILKADLFPHCPTSTEKLFFLAYMTNRLLRVSLGFDEPSDRDSYMNKRIDLCGTLLNNLFRNYFNKLVKDMQKQVNREINTGSWRTTDDYGNIINQTNIYKIIKATTIETGLKRALATGDFGIKQTASSKVGVAQVLNRLTYIAVLSHLRRINTPIDKSGKLIPPRKLHPTSWGFLCPAETPEGHSVGVVKNLSYMAHVTLPCDSSTIHQYVKAGVTPCGKLSLIAAANGVKVFINGCWVGNAIDPIELFTSLRAKKLKGIINVYVSIVFDYRRKEIRVCNEAGRPCRPLLKVSNNKMLLTREDLLRLSKCELTWDALLTDAELGYTPVEYVDACEQDSSLIAMLPRNIGEPAIRSVKHYTHCELHPSTIFGILASCIPFPEHNQSPRNTYQCAMGKQAIGTYATNYDARMDKSGFLLTYPMRPLVDTRLMSILQLHKVPSGGQVIVAIMTHSGYNQEDSILFNRASVDRGMFQATVTSTVRDEDKKVQGDAEIRGAPDPAKTKGMKYADYSKLGADGLMPVNTRVRNRDIIIGKRIPIKAARNDPGKHIKFSDCSHMHRTNEETYVDRTLINRNGDGYTFCKVRVRALRPAAIGDKFSSRHGQKGTMGNIIDEVDMPYTANGLKPDIIINPHAIPSRMTIAQLKETLLGKALLELGLLGDGSSFGNYSVDQIRKLLAKHGFESSGNEVMYDGLTGAQMESSIFIGPAFYQRLKHMVKDKIHSRSYGPKVNLTRQPAEGRRRDGGHRFGEMERDCMCSHGAAAFTKSRMMEASDAFTTHCCRRCGAFVVFNDVGHIHECKQCGNRTDFSRIELPYACKLLFQELVTMNVAPRMITN